MSINYVPSNLPGQQAITQLSNNDSILDGKIDRAIFNKLEIDQLYTTLGAGSRAYKRELGLGSSLGTYTNWTHVAADTGYSVWSYPVSGYIHNTNNEIYHNDIRLNYMGVASSEATLVGFNKVFWCNSKRSGATYTDYTAEAVSLSGTAFTVGGVTAITNENVSGVLGATKNLVYTNLINGSVAVYHSISSFTENVDFTINYTNGTITLLSAGHIPNGTILNINYRAGYTLYIGSSGLFGNVNVNLAGPGVSNRYGYTFSSAAGWNTYSPTMDATNGFSNNGTISWSTLTGWAKQTVNSSNRYWIKINVVYPGTVYPTVYYMVKADATATKLVAMAQADIIANNYKWCYYNNKVYVTIPNDGDPVNEGVSFVKSSSSIGVKQNYFIYNNVYLTNYKITATTNLVVSGDVYTVPWTNYSGLVSFTVAPGRAPTFKYKLYQYKKIGKTVHATVLLTGSGVLGSGAGDVMIAIPFAANATYVQYGAIMGHGRWWDGSTYVPALVVPGANSSQVSLRATSTNAMMSGASMANPNREIKFALCYEAA